MTEKSERWPPFYCLRIRGIDTMASIGFLDFEKTKRQRLVVSVILMLEQPPPGVDDVSELTDYDFVRDGVLGIAASGHFNLQERFCEALLDMCLKQKHVLGAVVQTDKADIYDDVASAACRMARMGPKLDGFPWWTIDV